MINKQVALYDLSKVNHALYTGFSNFTLYGKSSEDNHTSS